MAEVPHVTVAMPTRNRSAMLATCLASLLVQDYPNDRYEIVVADDGSRDDTPRTVSTVAHRASHPRVRYLRLPQRGSNAARNAALRVSTTDLICYVDDDTEVPPTWLSAIVAGALRHPEAGCVGGPIRLRLEGQPPRHCGADPYGEGELDLGEPERPVPFVHGGNMALRRSALDVAGPFVEKKLLGHDEAELMVRLRARGFPVVYIPGAWLWHRRTQTQLRLRTLVRRRFVRGFGQARAWEIAGRQYRVRAERDGVREGLRHAWDARCSWGLIQGAQAAGRLVGITACRAEARLGVRARRS